MPCDDAEGELISFRVWDISIRPTPAPPMHMPNGAGERSPISFLLLHLLPASFGFHAAIGP